MKWDVFISYASEDKYFVEPLAKRLDKKGLKVWYDKDSMTIGDSIRRSIDHGLSNSKFAIVVLSRNYFKKEWAKRELDALFAKETGERKVILPIWLNIAKAEVVKISPLLADRRASIATIDLAKIAKIGVAKIANEMLSQIKPIGNGTNSLLDSVIRRYRKIERFEYKFIAAEIILRFHQLVGCLNRLSTYIAETGFLYKKLSTIGSNKFGKEFEKFCLQSRKKFKIPKGVWGIGFDEAINCDGLAENYSFIRNTESLINKWVEGKMSTTEFRALHWIIEEEIDSDLGYIVFGIPNKSLKSSDFDKVDHAFFSIGTRNKKHRSTIV